MNIFNLPVAKRTRSQKQFLDQGFNGGINSGFCGSASKKSRKRNRETGFAQAGIKQEDHEIIYLDDDDGYGDGDGDGDGDCKIKNRASETDTPCELDDKIKSYGSASPFKTGKHLYFVYSDSDEDDTVVNLEEEEEDAEENHQTSSKLHHRNQNSTEAVLCLSTEDESSSESESEKDDFGLLFSLLNKRQSSLEDENNHLEQKMKMKNNCESTTDESSDNNVHEKTVDEPKEEDSDMDEADDDNNGSQNDAKASSLQSTEDDEDDLFTSSESESDDLDDSDFSLVNKRLHQPTQNSKEKICSEKNPSVRKTDLKKTDHKLMDESSEIKVSQKPNAECKIKDCYMKVDKTNRVKDKKSKMGGKRDYNARLDDILDSIISNEGVQCKKENDCLPLKFRFDDSDDESSKKTDESNGEDLFLEMEFAFNCDEIGSYKIPKDENIETDECYDDFDPCERGVHNDIYLEEQTGLRCCYCGAVLLESRYVLQKLATYAPDRSKRSHRFDEQQFLSYDDPYFMDSISNRYDICKQTKGTVWELIPANIRAHMYPHQQEGFEFLWKNLAGSIELPRLQALGPRGRGGYSGGCIISHAPGTGKTFLTIVFMESFLKKFPKCCPVIVAPASMLLTWEAEFKKWQVGFSFINLQNAETLRKEKIIGSSRRNKDYIRALKIQSWINGGGVLGVSYNLFEKLTRTSYKKNMDNEKLTTYLLDMPGLVVLDEGHTPRNQNSKIWITLLKLKTKNRVILSGTPFQNNFRELFNTLRIVRPETAKSILKEKLFADMIQRKDMKKCRNRSTSEDIEKLKEIISPFVHVHKGHILESNLPGLKQSVILLNPSSYQNKFIKNLGVSASTFEYEHKVALLSVHPSLILHCFLSKNEENTINKQELEDRKLQPKFGVKTRFIMELIRLSLSLNEKVLIFSQYIHPSELLQDQIACTFGWDIEQQVTLIKGNISQTRRQYIINAFNDPKSELRVLLASTKCCSEGIHLYGASRVVLLDVVWNPSVERQAISRAYRLGQKKVVYTYHLMAGGTTEEEKYDRQVEKGRLAEMVFSSASMAGGEPKNKVNVDDKILKEMVENQELKDMFNKIRYIS
ncbi:hypothetical protein R6Q57_015527 [Mikania cordata]